MTKKQSPSPTQPAPRHPRVTKALGERESLVKAALLGGDVQDSNVMQGVDEAERTFSLMGAIEPPYNPTTLAALLEHSNSLRQNVDAYSTNIDAFGHHFEPVIDLAASEAEEKIADAIYLERLAATQSPSSDAATRTQEPTPTSAEVATRKKELEGAMRLEKSRLEMFFDFCCVGMSFITLRRRVRQDLEVLGNGYFEALRNGAGTVCQFVYVPAFTVRLMPLDQQPTEARHRQKVSDLQYEDTTIRRTFRKFVQVFENRCVFFKEFGDPRVISAKRGEVFATVEDLKRADATDAPATELIHLKIHSSRTAYGVPRWIGCLLAVLGSRQAEEINYMYFENKSVPPLALLVSGGRVSEETVQRIKDFISGDIQGKRNFHKILVLEAEGSGSGTLENSGRMKIELKPLTDAQHSDALFQTYDANNLDKVGQSFRLPRMLRGDVRDFNRATADAALDFAEVQVFSPEREEFDFIVNRLLLADMGIRYWKFRSNSPTSRDSAELATLIKDLVLANVLTPEEGRLFATDVFNKELKKLDAAWTKQPVALTLAGIAADNAAPAGDPLGDDPETGMPEQKNDSGGDLTLADLQTDGGLMALANGRKFRRLPAQNHTKAASPEEALATRLLSIRNKLLDKEADQAAAAFRTRKREELETEVIKVPADVFRSFFASVDEPAPAATP